MSAEYHLNGPFYFNKKPLAQLGSAYAIYYPVRKSWHPHTTSVWHVRLAFEYYRCFTVSSLSTYEERVSDDVENFHDKHVTLKISNTYAIIDTTTNIAATLFHALSNKKNTFHKLYAIKRNNLKHSPLS